MTDQSDDIARLTAAIEMVVTEFVRPTAKQSLENQQAIADRKAFTARFDAMQAEIRQNQRLILSQGERLDNIIENL